MMDFLKTFPGITRNEYMWEWTIPQIKLASLDNTHTECLSEEQARLEKQKHDSQVYEGVAAFVNDLGMKIF